MKIMKTIGSLDVLLALIKSQGQKFFEWDDGSVSESGNLIGEETKESGVLLWRGKIIIGNTNYLLNQFLRQIWIPKEHQLVSKRAHEKWIELGLNDKDIRDFWYQKNVRSQSDCPVKYFKGNSSVGEDGFIKAGQTFQYRSVFHEDHIVPIRDIIDSLIQLKLTNDDQKNKELVKEVLNRIYTCRILKEEDRNLNRIARQKRGSTNYRDIVEGIYKKAGVEIDYAYEARK